MPPRRLITATRLIAALALAFGVCMCYLTTFVAVDRGRLTVLSVQQYAPEYGNAADCDGSGGLDINDFICFQTLYATGDPKADCDASGSLDIDDFICFQTLFAIGC